MKSLFASSKERMDKFTTSTEFIKFAKNFTVGGPIPAKVDLLVKPHMTGYFIWSLRLTTLAIDDGRFTEVKRSVVTKLPISRQNARQVVLENFRALYLHEMEEWFRWKGDQVIFPHEVSPYITFNKL